MLFRSLADLVFRKVPAFDQYLSQLSARAALILQRRLELLLRDELLLQEQIAEPYPLGTLVSDCLGHDPSLPSPLEGDFRLSSRATLPRSRQLRKRFSALAVAESGARQVQQS